jgi:hypothetical protein
MEKTWKHTRAKYGSGEELWVGKVCVAACFNPVGSKGSPTKYRAEIRLPTIAMKQDRQEADTAEEIKRRIENVVDVWFRWLDEPSP